MQVLNCQLAAKKGGYADVVYLDAKSDTYLEEVSSCNIFTVKGNTVRTPTLQVGPTICMSSCSPQHMVGQLHLTITSRFELTLGHAICAEGRSA